MHLLYCPIYKYVLQHFLHNFTIISNETKEKQKREKAPFQGITIARKVNSHGSNDVAAPQDWSSLPNLLP
jgi:hypothetical protein